MAHGTQGSTTKQCNTDGCDKLVRARGLCVTHYNRLTQPNRHSPKRATCFVCGATCSRTGGGGRKYGATCSIECRRVLTFGWSEPLPADHMARWVGRTCTWKPPAQPKQPAARFTAGQCSDCGTWYTAEACGSPVKYCSTACSRRTARRTRRALEHNATGTFRYTDVLQLFIANGRRCAYCDQPVNGLPDPEHVMPLSRGGSNDATNLVASCRRCNTDKGDLTLEEWAASRHQRDLPPVLTPATATDGRFKHLIIATPSRSAWRNRTAS